MLKKQSKQFCFSEIFPTKTIKNLYLGKPTYDILFMNFLRILFAIILPPLGVFLTIGIRGAFWLNILLTLLGYLPGIIHAVWIIAKYDKP